MKIEELVELGLYGEMRRLGENGDREAREIMKLFDSDQLCLFGETSKEKLQASWREYYATGSERHLRAAPAPLLAMSEQIPFRQRENFLRSAYLMKLAARTPLTNN